MNQLMSNRYVQLAGLILGLGVLFYLFVWVVFSLLQVQISWFVPFIISFGASTWLVWKFLASRIG